MRKILCALLVCVLCAAPVAGALAERMPPADVVAAVDALGLFDLEGTDLPMVSVDALFGDNVVSLYYDHSTGSVNGFFGIAGGSSGMLLFRETADSDSVWLWLATEDGVCRAQGLTCGQAVARAIREVGDGYESFYMTLGDDSQVLLYTPDILGEGQPDEGLFGVDAFGPFCDAIDRIAP